MKFPSVLKLVRAFTQVLQRYPFETFFAFAGTCAATTLVEVERNNLVYSNWCWRIIMAANLGLLLSFSTSLFSRSRKISRAKTGLLYVVAVLISVTFLFVFNPMQRESDIPRFLMMSFGFHLLVSFAAFIGKAYFVNAFWQFNRTLFLRFLTGALYSGVLFAGLSAAVGAMNFLFNFDFEWDTFAIMGVWIAGMFQTVFFLSGVPQDVRSLQYDVSYPSGLKLFTQYVLIPLASVYLIILISYEIKILISWNMPKGLVSSLILGYAVFGILSLLLVYPLRSLEGHKWINTFSKSFYFLLVPLLILLFLAIYARVHKYGITEERYILIALAVWLTFITAYFIFSTKQNIILIPVSLCILTLIGVYGPLSAFSIAKQSQLKQLKQLLAKNGAIAGGKMMYIKNKPDTADTDRLRDVSRYLISNYGLESLQPLMKQDLTEVSDSIKAGINKKMAGRYRSSKWEQSEAEYKWLYKNYKLPVNFEYVAAEEVFNVVAENADVVPLGDADFLIDFGYYRDSTYSNKLDDNKKLFYHVKDTIFNVRLQNQRLRINLVDMISGIDAKIKKGDLKKNPSFETENVEVAEQLDNDASVLPRSILTHRFELGGYGFTVLFNRLRYVKTEKGYIINDCNGVILLKKRTP